MVVDFSTWGSAAALTGVTGLKEQQYLRLKDLPTSNETGASRLPLINKLARQESPSFVECKAAVLIKQEDRF